MYITDIITKPIVFMYNRYHYKTNQVFMYNRYHYKTNLVYV